ncbi:MAG TPA: indolepyruvate oxidoreductase subunit beta [Rectinema sp.]|jgi:indolepyruvate ferredoxin oxidoreductase beta subunit|nr:indolepyruvate oxidoreductase subunit beta [Spirochaetota bacterium]HNP93187.1 indolepyruvate oxidoreductase subunit beta [Rectinema sp.]HNT59686.1 indolepyruvate oxidoreductase subunit beta [Rectinema sp.]HNV36267.1 indolepyruvate oxidoreductase subunit beta [Rectinema sp.]HNZ93906.1 indolepyruvate oxidoreductase subunit beta [Rectinema sp.]
MAKESEEIMTCDIILCSVGGQGGLSASIIIARAAMAAGFQVKQSEIHGMSQRGGEVLAHLRIADKEIYSPTISKGKADIMFALEPLEALRHLSWISPSNGIIVSATAPVLNIPDYPDLDTVLAEIRKIARVRLIDAEAIARKSGNVRTANLVLIGAAMDLLPISPDAIEKEIIELFSRKGESVVQANLKAFEAGRALYHG